MTDKNNSVWRYSNDREDVERKIRIWQKQSADVQQDIRRRIDRRRGMRRSKKW